MAVHRDPITFATWNPYVPKDMLGRDPARLRLEGRGTVYRPAGPGPHAGVVVAQGLGGPSEVREHAYGRWLAEHGYVALVIDSFASRGVRTRSDALRALRLTTAMILADGFAALRHLAADPAVDPARIGIVGFSYGGMVAILTAYRKLHELFLPNGPSFATHVSLYGCSVPRLSDVATTGAPLLVLCGRRDGNVSLDRTRAIVGDLEAGGSRVRFEILDVYHQWDGADRERRWLPFHVRQCRIRLNDELALVDEGGGGEIDGFWNRVLFLLRNTSFRGYFIQRDEDALARSNRLVLEALAAARAGPLAVAPEAGAARARETSDA
ncbi:MAG: dienelactone hydrolase family protein [Alphaproteobacteria bacterium]